MTPAATEQRVLASFRLGATGLRSKARKRQFPKEIRISVNYGPVAERYPRLVLAWWNPDEGRWERLPTEQDGANQVVTARTAHFSVFGVLADPPLHKQDVVINGVTYNTLNANAQAGTLDTVRSALSRQIDLTLQDAAGVSKFASNPVAAGQVWDIGGSWSFDVYVAVTNVGGALGKNYSVRAKVYKVDTNGMATALTGLLPSARTAVTGAFPASFTRVTWNGTVPATRLYGGERYAVEFYVRPEDGVYAADTFSLGYDTAGQPSGVTPAGVVASAPAQVRQAHFRIGQDDGSQSTHTWYDAADTPATSIARNQSFRVRFQVFNDAGAAVGWRPQLELAAGTGYAPVPTASGNAPFFVALTGQFADGAAITAGALGTPGTLCSTCTWDSTNQGKAYESSNPPGTAISLGANRHAEVEFNVQANANALAGATYYFRLTNAGVALATSARMAQIAMETPPPPTPTAAPPAHAMNPAGYTATTDACGMCHRTHSGTGRTQQKAWPGETVCYTCHDGSGAPDNIYGEFQKTYTHPVASTADVHAFGEARVGSSFSGAKRHVECVDCHDAHQAGATTRAQGDWYASAVLQGQWGVAPTFGTAWTAPTHTVKDPVQYEYEVCLKCHSSWAYGASPPASPSGGFLQTDQAKEFNPANASSHPIAGPGKDTFKYEGGSYQGQSYAHSLVGGMTPGSRLACSDCHNNNDAAGPRGPHGSANPFILRAPWNRTTGQNAGNQGRPDTSNHLCFLCHDYDTYTNRNNEGTWNQTGFAGSAARPNTHALHVGSKSNSGNGNAPIVCMDCHVAVPHGYFRDNLIGFTGDGAPYVNRPAGMLAPSTWAASGAWDKANCSTAHGSCD